MCLDLLIDEALLFTFAPPYLTDKTETRQGVLVEAVGPPRISWSKRWNSDGDLYQGEWVLPVRFVHDEDGEAFSMFRRRGVFTPLLRGCIPQTHAAMRLVLLAVPQPGADDDLRSLALELRRADRRFKRTETDDDNDAFWEAHQALIGAVR